MGNWKTDRYNHTKNKGKETKVSMILLKDTDSYRVRAQERIMGTEWTWFHDSIGNQEDSFQEYQRLCAEAISTGYKHPTGHPLLQSTNPAAQAAIDNAYHDQEAMTS